MFSEDCWMGLEHSQDACFKFGTANNLSGQIGERALKGIVQTSLQNNVQFVNTKTMY